MLQCSVLISQHAEQTFIAHVHSERSFIRARHTDRTPGFAAIYDTCPATNRFKWRHSYHSISRSEQHQRASISSDFHSFVFFVKLQLFVLLYSAFFSIFVSLSIFVLA